LENDIFSRPVSKLLPHFRPVVLTHDDKNSMPGNHHLHACERTVQHSLTAEYGGELFDAAPPAELGEKITNSGSFTSG